jgi:hypothetical protein
MSPRSLLVGGNKVSYESEDGENSYGLIQLGKADTVFCDRDDVGSSDFGDKNFLFVCSGKINMIGS